MAATKVLGAPRQFALGTIKLSRLNGMIRIVLRESVQQQLIGAPIP